MTWPANIALLVRITWLPRRQSWATWALAISRQLSPIVVSWSASNARCTVTFSRIVLPAPMTTRAGVFGHVDVLRQAAQHRALGDPAVLSQRGAALDRHVALQNTPAADLHPRLNHAKSPDPDIRPRVASGLINANGWISMAGALAVEIEAGGLSPLVGTSVSFYRLARSCQLVLTYRS